MILELHVQPGASRSEFAGKHGDRIKVRLAARAIDGKANQALRALGFSRASILVAFLAEHYGVPKSRVRIAAGLKSRQKRVIIDE